MKVERKLTELTKMVARSSIYSSIKKLEEELDIYQKSRFNRRYRYEVNQEILEIKQTLSSLKIQLKDLADQSVQREIVELK